MPQTKVEGLPRSSQETSWGSGEKSEIGTKGKGDEPQLLNSTEAPLGNQQERKGEEGLPESEPQKLKVLDKVKGLWTLMNYPAHTCVFV